MSDPKAIPRHAAALESSKANSHPLSLPYPLSQESLAVLKKYWGYESFRPLQAEAIACALEGRDSVVVAPTGGGKSVCFQVPALQLEGMAVVVSPLISLMKDQVDSLTESGISAARLDSTLSFDETDVTITRIKAGQIKVLYLSPERIVGPSCLQMLKDCKLSLFAVDEAHCVSMWGHDFRPEYRQLARVRKEFPKIPCMALTATATGRVRDDIAEQLQLDDPEMLVGLFDRPNLRYRVRRRSGLREQVIETIERYKSESGIIYCISRKNVESLCGALKANGFRAAPYHAGLENDTRKRNQDDFINDRVDIIVATVAFGMGIDKSNVRYVLHAGMPKSLEHYQQESGRAGRDGLPSDCELIFGGGDYGLWRQILSDDAGAVDEIAMSKLNDMYNYCNSASCRRKSILGYFGQEPEKQPCEGCDICMDNFELADNPLETSQKILSCVMRLDQRFGAEYTSQVLVGSKEKRILELGHQALSTYGLLETFSKSAVRDWVEQLVGQGYLDKVGDYNTLEVTGTGQLVLRGQATPNLLKPATKAEKKSRSKSRSKADDALWRDVDKDLFESLRVLRKSLAETKGVPPYLVFPDTSLRDMATRKPRTREDFLEILGVGEKKCAMYATDFLAAIREG